MSTLLDAVVAQERDNCAPCVMPHPCRHDAAPADLLRMSVQLLSAREVRLQIIALEEQQEQRGATSETTERLVSLYRVLYPATTTATEGDRDHGNS